MARKVKWKLRRLRLQKSADLGRDVTLEEVGNFVGLTPSGVAKLERNLVRAAKFETLEKFAEFYGLRNVEDLMQFEEEMRRTESAQSPALAGAFR